MKKYIIIETKTSSYELYNEGKVLFIKIGSNFFLVVGFANLPIHPDYVEPEGKSSYKFSTKISEGSYLIYKKSEMEFGYTEQIKKIKEPLEEAA